MAMYMFQELSPKIFYFTYCLQEPEKYIEFVEDSETNPEINLNLISKWEKFENKDNGSLYGYEKKISSDISKEKLPINGRTLYLVNSLKATFHHCFGQYKIYNNIQEEVNLNTDFSIKKYEEKFLHNEVGTGKYTAYMYINDTYEGGTVTFKGTKAFIKPEKASIIIAPSDMTVTSSPSLNGIRYVASGSWI